MLLLIVLCLLLPSTFTKAQTFSNIRNGSDFSHATVTKNANHIFNAVYSSMRTWGSTLKHNGMSFFPAMIPAGVKLYHGRSDNNDTVRGMEWLAFEQDFAYFYTGIVSHIETPCFDPHLDLASFSPLQRETGWTHRQQQQQRLISDSLMISHCPPINYTPGYFQTYTTTRPLTILYLDGLSGVKSERGTLDTQDLLLLNRTTSTSNYSDFSRAASLCNLAKHSWENRIDGFMRANYGFEVILCEFEGAVELTDSVRAERWSIAPPYAEKEEGWMELFSIYKSIEDQFWGLGRWRVSIDWERMVSVFAVEGVDVWVNGTEEQPRLTGMGEEQKVEVRERLSGMLLESKEGKEEATDWQAIIDSIISHYSDRLYDYAYGGDSYFYIPFSLSKNFDILIRPFIDQDNRNTTQELIRCSSRFLPSKYNPSIVATAAHQVSNKICKTLLEAESILSKSANQKSEDGVEEFRSLFRNLVKELAWPIQKFCRGCKSDEVCFTAAFPFGDRENLDRPSCKGFKGVADWFDTGYW